MNLTSERLQKLRDDARLERETILEYRVRGGQDPAVAYEEVPELDDFVVAALRDELLEDRGQLAEYGLARLAAQSSSADADTHRANADRVEFELLREIADSVPELAVAVWRAAGKLNVE
ncbi:hypothetical protein U746_2116 [Mycolicibacterium mucogenicum 261Sha1.1M5]|uniref:hypothetical protein n=1 Tax=Leucobacter aridicollis TaxID=283878 RepID=UPI000EB24586|nr:hypothetical protein [Leucobacter aridicollis]MCS3427243.1 hypothetical protein [Leucobacter aridicollis]RKQ85941.1 hypothetical protein U746_2116 [Mycolicibacterium mucogenicum 261Sha1.1M5]